MTNFYLTEIKFIYCLLLSFLYIRCFRHKGLEPMFFGSSSSLHAYPRVFSREFHLFALLPLNSTNRHNIFNDRSLRDNYWFGTKTKINNFLYRQSEENKKASEHPRGMKNTPETLVVTRMLTSRRHWVEKRSRYQVNPCGKSRPQERIYETWKTRYCVEASGFPWITPSVKKNCKTA